MGIAEDNEVNMGGWNAVSEAFHRLYADTLDNTKQYGVMIPWELGGPDPLDNVQVYDGGDYWHFVSFGLSELYEKESENKDISGYGMEFTVKLKKGSFKDEEGEIRCIISILQDLAKLTFENGELFLPYEYIYTGQEQGIDMEGKSMLTGFITVPETKVEKIDTPNGEVVFVELIGATDSELQAIKNQQLRVKELYEKLGTDVTDYDRQSVI